MVGQRLSAEAYAEVVKRRRAFELQGYKSLSDVGFDGPWVTPLQKAAGSLTGPVLIAFNWLDAPAVEQHRSELAELGYLPTINFNRVLDAALRLSGLARSEVYLTEAFHLLPGQRSGSVPLRDVQASFEAITRYEIAGRPVVALGSDAANACRRTGVACVVAQHPSARSLSFCDRAAAIAEAIGRALA